MNTYILYKVISPSNKIYVGITKETISSRISKHKYVAKKGKTKFSKAINKYGINNLIWMVCRENLTKEEAIKLEKQYIKFYNSFKNGYNSTLGGEGAFGYKWDKNLHKKYHKEREEKYYKNEFYRKRQSEVLKNMYKKKNPHIKQKALKNLENARKNKTKQDEEKRLRNLRSLEVRKRIAKSKKGKPFNVYDWIQKKYIGTWEVQKDFQREFNISRSDVSRCLLGKRNRYKNLIFKYTDDPTVIKTEFNDLWLDSIKRGLNGTRRKKNGKN